MNTTLDLVNIVFRLLASSPIQITGALYKLRRPRSTSLEDIVILPLVIQTLDESTQTGILSINLHVPNIDPDGSGNMYPDTARLSVLSAQIVALVNLNSSDNYLLTVHQQKLFQEDNLNESFLNIRVQALLINT